MSANHSTNAIDKGIASIKADVELHLDMLFGTGRMFENFTNAQRESFKSVIGLLLQSTFLSAAQFTTAYIADLNKVERKVGQVTP